MPVPPGNVTLKEPKDFTLIGTPCKRLDYARKVNGRARYGIDAAAGYEGRLGRRLAVFGGKLNRSTRRPRWRSRACGRWSASTKPSRSSPNTMWAAKKGLAAAAIWDDGAARDAHHRRHRPALEKASQEPGLSRATTASAKALAGAAQRIDAVYQVPSWPMRRWSR